MGPTRAIQKVWFVIAMSFIVHMVSAAVAAIPAMAKEGLPAAMSYEGYVTDVNGVPLPDGSYDFDFGLYTSPEGGPPIWEERHKNVTVKNGFIRLYLGKGTPPRPLDIPFDQQYFLGVHLGQEPEMMPRLELTASPYSFRAKIAEEVEDGSITNDKLAPLSVADENIKSISWSKITGIPEVEATGQGPAGGVPANVWSLFGNRKTDCNEDFIGTTDFQGLVLKTDNQERMKIKDMGDIDIVGSLDVNLDVTVGRNLEVGNDASILNNVGIGDYASTDATLAIRSPQGNTYPLFVQVDGTANLLTMDNEGVVRIRSDKGGLDGDKHSYPLFVEGRDQGMAIELEGSTHNGNNFIAFLDDDGFAGRIEGQTYDEWTNSFEFIWTTAMQNAEALFIIAEGVACGVQTDFFEVAVMAAEGTRVIAEWSGWFVNGKAKLGVAYESGSGDYAEYLRRLNPEEVFDAGDIVGVFGGKISKCTKNAQQILPISLSPIVLGNMPPEGQEHLYEKVAFMGQVSVKVSGRVKEGDFIIPSGLEDGTGIAVPPEMMTADEYTRVVGRAWDASDAETVKYVNVVVGLNSGDIAEIVERQQAELRALRCESAAKSDELRRMQADLDELRAQLAIVSDLREAVVQLRAAMAHHGEMVPAAGQGVKDASVAWHPMANVER